jgi:hypothetical protein
MSASSERRQALLSWFGLLGAPLAWTVQFLVGFTFSEAACNEAGTRWGVPVDGAAIVATVAAATIAVLAGLAALAVFRETRHARGKGGAEEEPPLGRVHFLATIGIAISPLFLFIIVMNGVGVAVLANCHQS